VGYAGRNFSDAFVFHRVSLFHNFIDKTEAEKDFTKGGKDIMRVRALILSAAFFMFVIPAAFGQTINQRKDNQQERIGQGVQSGQLTAGETRNLEGKEAGLNHEEHAMRAADNGHLTAGDRAVINHQQNRMSQNIYADKHNGRVR
jgi:hypothetical protein